MKLLNECENEIYFVSLVMVFFDTRIDVFFFIPPEVGDNDKIHTSTTSTTATISVFQVLEP